MIRSIMVELIFDILIGLFLDRKSRYYLKTL